MIIDKKTENILKFRLTENKNKGLSADIDKLLKEQQLEAKIKEIKKPSNKSN